MRPVGSPVIEVAGLTKHYGDKVAVSDLTFTARPGEVTGFLGPNGSGKSTTMRMVLGLDKPTRGTATINGVAIQQLSTPLTTVGAMLDAADVNGGFSAKRYLQYLARSNGISSRRVDAVLSSVGLAEARSIRIGNYSLGMKQRLGLAAALLGDPSVIVLDEPSNGLDPEGILWLRGLIRRLANDGRTVFVSSHQLLEMEKSADQLIVIGMGRLLSQGSVDDVLGSFKSAGAFIRTPSAHQLRQKLTSLGMAVRMTGEDELFADEVTAQQLGRLAWEESIMVYELRGKETSLEESFMAMTSQSREYETVGEG